MNAPPTQIAEADPVNDPDPTAAAEAAATAALLRCWTRETAQEPPGDGTLRLPLPASGAALRVPVLYWSATGHHRFGRPVLHGAPADAPPVDAVTLAALLGREVAYTSAGGDGTDLVARVADSTRRTAAFLARPPAEADRARFLTGEQSLVLGHPLHPTPNSREGLTDTEAAVCSPELRGSFPLHWYAVDPAVLAADSHWTQGGRTVDAPALARQLAGGDGDGLPLPPGSVPLPVHPWQAREVRDRPEVAALLDAGLLRDLGPYGPAWHPTASVRTVFRPGAPAMLKLSLGIRITNSRRENLRKELHRGVEVHRLLRSGLGEQWAAACPAGAGFDIVRDPAWLGVDTPGGDPVQGLDVVIRHQPFADTDDVWCVAALTAPRPVGRGGTRSRLQEIVAELAHRTGRSTEVVGAEWFLRYLETVVRPVLWLDAEAGVALEAHQQNTLVVLDADGWPAGGRYRDNQGYYFRDSRRADLERRLPGIGAKSDTFVADEVADERFAYYLGINNVLGLIGSFGAAGLVPEPMLLAAFRGFLTETGAGPHRLATPLPGRLLGSPTLRCKANLLTRLHGLDELVGPVDTQSVYVTVPNPLVT
ncbi:N(2)-citryl-N(6)-acetyl-N(6)-hydroxylysine synthase [Streptomyces sp. RB5]|uniref:N(2)-citryl-N(6)-acetyl-N(6)-hydroxylysine synthase n=1 Tax=Streptomyces smaragdinus TaxID=2585196 RepID=A0A7K0CRI7_9ACTN|nr:IucA/IucC family protein [Streptomyces smaragdinus]MQY15364.1 N(2)-citryl-N(6)-acetyl-N(6)-hydroxylysine synthase [Streptomyces smaragdinus]